VDTWDVNPGFGNAHPDGISIQQPFRRLETPPRSVLHSGRQLAIRLAEFGPPSRSATNHWSGVEIRLFLQPLQSPAGLTDIKEIDFGDYIAGFGLAGMSQDSILKLIKELPIEPQAAEESMRIKAVEEK